MRKNIIMYSLVAIFFIIAFYFVSLSQIIIDTQNKFNAKVFSEAKETKNFNEFMSIQTKGYKLIEEFDDQNYNITIYQIVTSEDINSFVIIVLPNINNIEYASSLNDKNDKTNISINELSTNKELFASNNDGIALSYGFNEDQLGFMYFDFTFKDKDTYSFSYLDYNGEQIYSKQLLLNFPVTSNIEEDGFTLGYTIDELKVKMELNDSLKKSLTKRLTIAISIIVFIPFVYEVIKRIILKINMKKSIKYNKNN